MIYGISGIGYPMGLGNYGLGATGSYGSYDNYMPSMMGMNGMTGMYPSVYGAGYGMMGMYNPTFMAQMQNQVEEMQLQHAGNMHSMMLNNDVRATRETDQAIINKLLTNASVQQNLSNLQHAVREGNQDGICEEFDKLRNQVYHTYKDELKARGSKENPATAATRIVEMLYSSVVSAQTGENVTLRNDIIKYGDSAMMNGFMKGFRQGHHDKYIDETLNHCFGDDIDERGSKEVRQGIGYVGGSVASIAEKGLIGAGAGAAIYGVGSGVAKGLAAPFGALKSWKPFKLKHFGKAAAITAAVAMVGDLIWQIASPKS